MNRARRGSGLIEVLVALPLIVILGLIAVRLLISVQRDAVRLDGKLGATRELRHSAGILLTEWRTIRSQDLIAWNDTAVEFESLIGTGIACAADPLGQWVAIARQRDEDLHTDPDPVEVIWNATPQPGDQVHLWLASATPLEPDRAAGAAALAAAPAAASPDCNRSPLRPFRTQTVRLVLSDSLAGRVAIGAPVRITRRTRYSLYRGADGGWFLGRRTLGPLGWDIVQPVAGPLASARDRGLRIMVSDSAGAALPSGTGSPRALNIALRAPRTIGRPPTGPTRTDSVSIAIALRSARSDAP